MITLLYISTYSELLLFTCSCNYYVRSSPWYFFAILLIYFLNSLSDLFLNVCHCICTIYVSFKSFYLEGEGYCVCKYELYILYITCLYKVVYWLLPTSSHHLHPIYTSTMATAFHSHIHSSPYPRSGFPRSTHIPFAGHPRAPRSFPLLVISFPPTGLFPSQNADSVHYVKKLFVCIWVSENKGICRSDLNYASHVSVLWSDGVCRNNIDIKMATRIPNT